MKQNYRITVQDIQQELFENMNSFVGFSIVVVSISAKIDMTIV